MGSIYFIFAWSGYLLFANVMQHFDNIEYFKQLAAKREEQEMIRAQLGINQPEAKNEGLVTDGTIQEYKQGQQPK